MSLTETELRAQLEQDRRAVRLGVVVTAIVTVVFFVLPNLLPVEAFRRWLFSTTGTWLGSDNPFTVLRLFGGVLGAGVAGWSTSDLGSGAVTGVKAAMYGLLLAYLLTVAFYLVYVPLAFGVFPPPLFDALAIPMVHAIPMFGTYLVSGLLVGALADALSPTRVSP